MVKDHLSRSASSTYGQYTVSPIHRKEGDVLPGSIFLSLERQCCEQNQGLRINTKKILVVKDFLEKNKIFAGEV